MNKLNIISGFQPTGDLTLGNYISSLSNCVEIQDKFKCFYLIADLHAITKFNKNFIIKDKILNTLSLLISSGVNPKKSIIFLQSKISEHLKLFWIFQSIIKYNKMTKMHKFSNKDININMSLFSYPILMSSDILLYNINYVNVGYDQKQHIELVRYISKKVNNEYKKKIFNIPNYYKKLNKDFYIMSLINPYIKMSKSDNKNSYISLLDDKFSIENKIAKAITDSNNPPIIKYDIKNKPGISNLINIASKINKISIRYIEEEFKNKNYNYFKKYICDVLINKNKKIQNIYNKIRNNEKYLFKIIELGCKKAKIIAKNNIKFIKNLL